MKEKRSTYSNASLKLNFISGQGGQGNVYSAVHIYTNLPVAVKVTNWKQVFAYEGEMILIIK